MTLHQSFRTSEALAGVVTCAALIGVILLAIELRPLPDVVAANAPPDQFSSERAFRHVREIANAPHPTGSTQHALVGDYLIRGISAIGLEPFIQQASMSSRLAADRYRVGTVRNIAVRKAGTASTKAMLFMAHYDSAADTPGAADNGAGVAALLEILRALQASAPLKNDLIVLFSDAEEQGLLGARLFLKEHPWAKDVGVAANFEARGASGPSMLFETGDRDAWLARDFARSAPHPYASSLVGALSRTARFQTDLNVFKQARIPSLNFAFAETWASYHGHLDRPDLLDGRSLQHHGSNGLALARYLGDLDLNDRHAGEPIYFNAAGTWMASYSSGWVPVLGLAVVAAFLAVLIVGIRRGRLSLWGVLLGFVGSVAIVVVVAIATLGLMEALEYATKSHRAVVGYSMYLYAIGILCFSCALTSLCYRALLTRTSVANLFMGASLTILLLAVVTSILAPGVSYVFVWPLAASLAVAPLVWNKSLEDAPVLRALVLVGCAIPWLLLVVPTIQTVYVLFMMAGAFFASVAVALALGLLVPSLKIMMTPRWWVLPSALAVAMLAILAVAMQKTADPAANPKREHLFYVADQDARTAIWATNTQVLSPRAARLIPASTAPHVMGDVIPEWYGQPWMRTARFFVNEAPLASRQSDVSILRQAPTPAWSPPCSASRPPRERCNSRCISGPPARFSA